MADIVSRSFASSDCVVELPNVRSRIVELGDLIGELVSEPRCEDRGTHGFEERDGEWRFAEYVPR